MTLAVTLQEFADGPLCHSDFATFFWRLANPVLAALCRAQPSQPCCRLANLIRLPSAGLNL